MATGINIDAIYTSLLLATASAGLTHLTIRYTRGIRMVAMSLIALGLFSWALYLGPALGGFWAGFYVLLSAYFLACMLMPWIDLAVRRAEVKRRAG